MKLIQLHEYLALLEGGSERLPIEDALSKACLKQARALWPQLRIHAWRYTSRRVECVVRCHASGKLLVHISADWENCFLILVVPPKKTQANAYFLFDIGAEYNPVRFSCPAFDIDQVAEEHAIKHCIPRLHGVGDPFAILDSGDGTYIQAYAEKSDVFHVEHQLVSLSSHYRLPKRVDAGVVIDLFLSYAFGKKEWARDYSWKKMKL